VDVSWLCLILCGDVPYDVRLGRIVYAKPARLARKAFDLAVGVPVRALPRG